MSIYDFIPVPNLMAAKRILCVQPHPDDMDVACGGTLALLANEGAHITYLTVTDGSAGSAVRVREDELAATRRNEQTAAGAFIGVSDYQWLDYPDAAPLSPAIVQDDIIRAIRALRPDTLVTVDPWLAYEAHPAHRAVGQSAAAAALFSAMPNISVEHSDQALAPHSVERVVFAFTANANTHMDVTTTWERKVKAIRSHQSQFPDEVWPMYESYFRAQAQENGRAAGCELAENLRVLSPVHLHCNVDV